MSRPSSSRKTAPREVMVTQPEELAVCCRDLAQNTVIGWDTEFISERSLVPELCLIQISTFDTLYLIDPLSVGPLDELWQILTDPGRTVVCHGSREEIRICQHLSGRLPRGIFDLQIAAGLVGLTYPMGHAPLVHHLLGKHLKKGETMSDWRRRPLTRSQIDYAFGDVRYLLPAWKALSQQLDEMGRMGWAREEFERLIAQAQSQKTKIERWRKIRGLGKLNRRELSRVQALYAWREEKAIALNRPARSILRDDLLVEIARRDACREDELSMIRGLPQTELSEILEVLDWVRGLPESALPVWFRREPAPPSFSQVTSFLSLVLRQMCRDWQIAWNLVASTGELREVAQSAIHHQPLPETSPFSRGWRNEIVLPQLLAVLEGKFSIRLSDPRSEQPFHISRVSNDASPDQYSSES